MSAQLTTQLKYELFSRWQLVPSAQWLKEFAARTPNPSHPLPALASTAHFRLLVSDFTSSLSAQPGQVFPAGVSDVAVKELVLQGDIAVQVLDIIDTGTSKWAQIEAIERVERGEEIRGREVIRNVPGADGNEEHNQLGGEQGQSGSNPQPSGSTASNTNSKSRKGSTGPHKILLQDAAGIKVWAFEVSRLDKIAIVNTNPPVASPANSNTHSRVEGTQIGCKLMIKSGTKVRRGLLMLTPASTTIMGGRVEIWDQKWREGRKARLQQELDQENAG